MTTRENLIRRFLSRLFSIVRKLSFEMITTMQISALDFRKITTIRRLWLLFEGAYDFEASSTLTHFTNLTPHGGQGQDVS